MNSLEPEFIFRTLWLNFIILIPTHENPTISKKALALVTREG